MACDRVHCWWTFIGLVGAFLDLAIVYLLLCASTVAYFASRFLGIFGLSLPCPCNGLFGVPGTSYCAQRLLIGYPTDQISNVQFSVKSKFPFDSLSLRDQDHRLNSKLGEEEKMDIVECIEMKGESSCSSTQDGTKSVIVVGKHFCSRNETRLGALKQGMKEGRFDLKGQRIMNQRTKGGVRRRKKGSVVDYGKFSSVSSYGYPHSDVQGVPQSPAIIKIVENERREGDGEHVTDISLGKRASYDYDLDEILGENVDEKDLSFQGGSGRDFDNDPKNTIRVLEQALKEEQAARATLYFELEKERNAAATAAEEAMAMILRLQEEKAAIEMETRQYQRIIEEKAAYDAEEMNILKEILLRREREKLFLEKEVEAYREMAHVDGEALQNDIQGMGTKIQRLDSSLLDPEWDPVLMLQKLSQSIDSKEVLLSKSSDDVISINKQRCAYDMDKELHVQGQEEYDGPMKPENLDKYKPTWPEKNISLSGEEQEQNSNCNLVRGMAIKTAKTEIHNLQSSENLNVKTCGACKELGALSVDMDSYIQDIHIIDDEPNLRKEAGENKYIQLPLGDGSYVNRNTDLSPEVSAVLGINSVKDGPSGSRLKTEPGIKRSTSDSSGLPPMGPRDRSKLCNWQRNSITPVDNERLKIENEVGWLQERLRIVQEGRQKFDRTIEHGEKEKMQFELLEDMYRLWSIRQLTEPGKTQRQTSLPLPSSEIMSKKRRCRSASLEV